MNKLLESLPKYITVDFDGTLFETKYPTPVAPITEVLEYCIVAQSLGSVIILNTLRKGEELCMAVNACRERGLVFDYINENPPELIEKWEDSRKIYGDIYIDDRNVSISDIKEYMEEYKRRCNDVVDMSVFNVNSVATDIYGDNYDWEEDPCRLKQLEEEPNPPELPYNPQRMDIAEKLWRRIHPHSRILINCEKQSVSVKCPPEDVPTITAALQVTSARDYSMLWDIGGPDYE